MRESLYKGFYANENGEDEIIVNNEKIKGWWVKGDLLTDYLTGQHFIHPYGDSVNESDKVNEEGCLRFFAYEVIQETVREFVNLMDCDFNKIFNCDLLKDEEGTIWLITYATGWWSYQIVSQNTKVQQHCTIHPITRTNVGDYLPSMKIIGNKFVNPELVKD